MASISLSYNIYHLKFSVLINKSIVNNNNRENHDNLKLT